MPATAASATQEPTALAPDGIAIHTFATPPGAHVGVAEGRIPPGRYSVHRHLSLEQYTYVVAGRVTAITGSREHPEGQATTLKQGDLLLTLPGESLQFVNDGTEEARALFICAPPYPPDDADTHLLDRHGPPSSEGRAAAVARLEAICAEFNRIIDERIAALGDDRVT